MLTFELDLIPVLITMLDRAKQVNESFSLRDFAITESVGYHTVELTVDNGAGMATIEVRED